LKFNPSVSQTTHIPLIPRLPNLAMDLSDVGIRHAVSFVPLNIKHSIDISPTAVSIAKEVRHCVIAIVLGFAAVSVVKSLLAHEHSKRSLNSAK
jgi:hypothetical protein